MSTRIAGFIAIAVLIVSATSFTAQEPPRPAPNFAPPMPELPPPVLPVAAEPTQEDLTMRLEFRAGKEKGDHRIIWKRDGVEIEAVRINIGPAEVGMELVALADGISVQSRAFTTVCKSIEIRPGMMGADARSLPPSKSNGHLFVDRMAANYVQVKCRDIRFECTKLVLAGEKNQLVVTPVPEGLHVKTKDAEIRALSVSVQYQVGFNLALDVTTSSAKGDAPQKIRLAQQP
jgi:hypothetical protein